MTRLGDAIYFAAAIHSSQTDKAGAPYMLHAIAVMEMVAPDEDAMIVGALHDVLEDCHDGELTSLERQIRDLGEHIFDAVQALTHRSGELYDAYIERVALNRLATKVKIADLTHNMDPRRIPAGQIVDKDFERWHKYRKALIRLTRGPYLAQMIADADLVIDNDGVVMKDRLAVPLPARGKVLLLTEQETKEWNSL